MHDIAAVGIDKAHQEVKSGGYPQWSERPDVVELSSGLSAPNRTCTFPRIRLSISSVAHSKDKIGVTRFKGISLLFTQDIRIAFRQPPPELTLAAGHQSPQRDAARYSLTVTTTENPGLGSSGLWSAYPMTAKGFEGGAILAREPVPELPKDDLVQTLEHHGRVISELVEVRPSRKDALQTLHHVNFVNAVIARQLVDKLPRKTPVLCPRYRRDGPHAAAWSSFPDDPVAEKDKAVVHVRDMGFRHIEREFQFAFQKGPAGFPHFQCVRLGSFHLHRKIIRISTVRHRWLPLPAFSPSDRSLLEDAKVPRLPIFPHFLAQVVRFHPLIELIQHDVR